MKGKWVWAVNLIQSSEGHKIEGTNSIYADYEMAKRKRERLLSEYKKFSSWKGRVILRRVMYFKDKVEENSFDDYCSICGGQLKIGEKLSETYKSSLDKP